MDDYVAYYKQMISHNAEVYANIANMSIYVKPSVFDPDPTITYTSIFIIKKLMTLNLMNKTVLDMGCGSSVLGLYCLRQGVKHVCFVDNDDAAINNTTINTAEYTNKTIIKSNLFENVEKTKYDIILFNYPICDGDWNTSCLDTLKNYCKQIKSYMHETTYAFNVFASFGNIDLFKKMLKKYKFGFGTTPEMRFGVEWVLFTIGRDIPKHVESEKITSTHHTHHHTHHHKHHTKQETPETTTLNFTNPPKIQLDEPAELYH
jgi:hypothetical protein